MQPRTTRIHKRLSELQAGHPSVAGLLLVSRGGFVVASTFRDRSRVDRLAAVSRAFFLLAGEAATVMGVGDMRGAGLTFNHGHNGDDAAQGTVMMRPVGDDAMLVVVLHDVTRSAAFLRDVEFVVAHLAHAITLENDE